MTDSSTHKANILVVDDTVENLQLITAMLQERRFESRPVLSGRLALQAVAADPPDLILLDINMPEMDGFEVCRRLKANEASRDIPVIFISALNETLDKVKAFQVGGVDYITKPFQFEEVVARVETHLALRRLQLDLVEKNRQLEQSLARQRELENTKERLVQMIVHDLKSPLASIMGNSHYLLEELPAESEAAEVMSDVADATTGMHRMVLNILDVMQLRNRKLEARRAPLNLPRLAESTAKAFRAVTGHTRHTVEIESIPGMPRVSLDRDLIQRVLENLIDNSLKYAPGETPVIVKLGVTEDGETAIDISDHGPGVPEEMRREVFELYTRLDRDRAREARKSRGLGLAFCKMAVEAHGGRIWIDDNKPRGSVFRIRIPAADNPDPISRRQRHE